MRSVIGNLLVVIVFLASIGLAQKSAGEQPGMVEGRVVRVIDGDTINVERTDRSVVVVKLQGIDAPEEKQPFGKRSRKNLEEILIGKDVNVVVHKKDQGGGYIGTVFLAGRDVGLLQVEWGMAWHYKQFGYEQSPDSRKRYAQAEEKARTDRLGLWEKGDAVPPWDFRG
jgi:endonuclease YncB( thermonuclease family)